MAWSREREIVSCVWEKLWREIEQLRVEKEYESLQLSDTEFQSDQTRGRFMPKAPKLLVFDDVHDDVDSFLLRFERYAKAQNWDEENLLWGKAFDVYALVPKTDALNNHSLKTALLV